MSDEFFMDEDNQVQARNTIRFCPSLYVFLGSSPAQIGWRLKKLQVEAYGDLPIFQHLWIDTDTTIPPEIEPWLRNSNVKRTNMGNVNPRLILENINNFPSIKAWWPEKYNDVPNSLGPGAAQVRSLGRMGLFGSFTRNIGDNLPIRESLQNAAQRVLGISKAQAVTNMLHPDMDYELDLDQVRVYVVNSVCGGTGSGIALDVAYLLREFFSRLTQNYTIIGVQLLPPIFEKAIGLMDLRQKDKIKSNGYSFLQDLDYLTEMRQWTVSYPTMETDITAPPFDMVYVIDLANKSGQFFDQAMDVYKMTSQALFLLSVSPMSGAQVSSLANTSVQDPRFQGKIPYLSSFASASLVYPKDRLLQYCSARLAVDSINKLRSEKYSEETDRPDHVTILDQHRLNPNTLRGQIRDRQNVVNEQLQFILAAKDPGTALAYISNESSNDEIERAGIISKIEKTGKELTESIKSSLILKLTEVNTHHGPFYAKELAEALLRDKAGINSLNAYIKQIDLDSDLKKISEKEKELTKVNNELANLDKKWSQVAFKAIFKREWISKFNSLKAEAVNLMADINDSILNKEITEEMKGLYNLLVIEVQGVSSNLTQLSKRLSEVGDFIMRKTNLLLGPQSKANLFQLSIEVVDGKYFQQYYQDRKPNIDTKRVFEEFINNQTTATFQSIIDAKVTDLARALMKAAESPFRQSLENAHILEEMRKHYGDQNYLSVLEKRMDSVINYCHPFWRYLPIDEDLITMAPAYIGVNDAQSDTIPEKYRDGGVFNLISTGVKDAIYVARAEHGVTPWMLTELPVWRKAYDNYKNSGAHDPLNIIPDASRQAVDPNQSRSSAEIWAVSLAFGFVTKRGNFYYYDKDRKYKNTKTAKSSDRIEQGREKAADKFATISEWVNGARELINSEIEKIGITEAVKQIEAFEKQLDIESLELDEENSIRKQLEKEIASLKTAVEVIKDTGKI